MTEARHFSVAEWVDFVRSATSHVQQRAMQEHLDGGCRPCADMHDEWTLFTATVESERRYDPPATVVRLVKAAFDIPKQPRTGTRVVEAARLIFDSRQAPAAVGVRGITPGPRVLMYAAGPLLVDVQIGEGRGRAKTILVGQVTDSRKRLGVGGAEVRVLQQEDTIAATSTNHLGEFHVEFDAPTGDWTLGVDFENGSKSISLAI